MKKSGYVEGSGNVYADLGVANPQEARAKADLAHRIVDIIEERKLTQVQAGKVLGVDQPKVSALKRGRLTDFSVERPPHKADNSALNARFAESLTFPDHQHFPTQFPEYLPRLSVPVHISFQLRNPVGFSRLR